MRVRRVKAGEATAQQPRTDARQGGLEAAGASDFTDPAEEVADGEPEEDG